MKNSISIVILAAGKGTRMRSSKPKVLHEIAGKAMLYYSIKVALTISDDVSIVVAHQKDEVISKMGEYFKNITFIEQDIINFGGTGGALRDIKPKYEKVLVLNGDMPLIDEKSLNGFLHTDADIVMSILELDDPNGYGRVVLDNGRVKKIVEQKDASSDELLLKSVNAGVYMFKKSMLDKYIPILQNNNAQGEYYLTDVISLAVEDNYIVKSIVVDELYFKGVNSKVDLSISENIMLQRLREYWMLKGVVMQLPQSIYLEEGVSFEGECILENGVRICGDSKIINSHIKAHSVIEDSTIIDSDIGPLAHIRPHSHIKKTHIGNFVEVKKSTLTGVKAGHLSYIGDASIDEGSNIGAGVITCNYDGKKKYQTKIGKNVFVGSDTQLVAPLEVEDDVLIAAGTTVTSGTLKKGSLALSRVKLSMKDGFYYKFFNSSTL